MSKISREALLEMAQKAGITVHASKQQARIGIDVLLGDDSTEKLERFAELVSEFERYRCVNACRRVKGFWSDSLDHVSEDDCELQNKATGAAIGAAECIDEIMTDEEEGA